MQITAAVAHASGGPLGIETLELDDPRPDEILVRLDATGLCHTDLAILDQVPLRWPAVLGHEGAGVVVRVGASVRALAPGDHVVLVAASCGDCASCRGGQPSYCLCYQSLNLGGGRRPDGSWTHRQHGRPAFGSFFGQSSFATYALATERNAVRVDADLPLQLMATLGCGVLTGAGAVLNTLRVRPASSVAVFGAGAVGLAAVMAARIAGCASITAVDTRPQRLRLAAELGADRTIDAGDTDAVAVLEKSGGVDYAVEAAGHVAVMQQAVAALAPGGEAALVGVTLGQSVRLDPTLLQSRGLTVRGTLAAGRGSPADLVGRLAGHWREGRLPIERLVTVFDFADIGTVVERARAGSVLKAVLRMPHLE
ncbi:MULTISPECIES: NAD(P)-dependent alcohol dehydrogenase [Frankia]|uniref:Aryl-alcohol dehydrogenase (Benzyl alcohol dehydrogenase) (BADH) n=3 Tax=Frankia TaxID=1854 RepID=Q0RGJ0_FRAAA|nr:NAD(P)-dependent alcohol dehydrogenase [Frankia alni]CAJ63397.1 Aryl-alcohol dehydrogenase (Benzyl alcohol dehydrogenase) (BADH) [Frankia alni ACN14a]